MSSQPTSGRWLDNVRGNQAKALRVMLMGVAVSDALVSQLMLAIRIAGVGSSRLLITSRRERLHTQTGLTPAGRLAEATGIRSLQVEI